MTFLPIVDRELRVAARLRGTYWSRVIMASLVILIAGGVLLITGLAKGGIPVAPGQILFQVLKWLSFVATAVAGIFFTSDSLSEEKREGTLGLLFLTDLRGHDVVLGKLMATSLRAAFGLLAVFPILGLSILLGGVSGGEFWRVILVLANTLFFSLATGMFISSVSRDTIKAVTGALVLGAFFFLLLPALDAAVKYGGAKLPTPLFSLASPSLSATETGATRLGAFWCSVASTHGLGWVFIALASFCTPRSWQQKTAGSGKGIRLRILAPSLAKRTAARARMLERDPVLWLADRDPWLRWALRALVLVELVLLALAVGSSNPAMFATSATFIFYLLALPFGLWVALHASRFFCDGKRNGMLELVLATPVPASQIVSGHWQAMRQLFLLPTLALLLVSALAGWLQIEALRSISPPGSSTGFGQLFGYQVASHAVGLLTFVTGLGALAWFGMWMGLTSRKTSAAFFKTIVFVKVLPWLVLSFVQGILLFSVVLATRGQDWMWVSPLVSGGLALGIDVAFIVVARRKLVTSFREMVAQTGGPVLLSGPLPTPSR